MGQRLQAKDLAPVELIDETRFARLEPRVASAPEISALCNIEGAVDPLGATKALIKAAVQSGARSVFGGKVHHLISANGQIAGVETELGIVYADKVIVAAGTATASLLKNVDIRLRRDNGHGLVIHTTPVEPILDHIILAPDIHFRQELDGTIVAADHYSGGELSEDPIIIQANDILQRLRQRLPDVTDLKMARIMLGTSPVPLDGFPAVGWLDDKQTLYVATMHSGVTLAALMGRLIAEEVIDGTAHNLLAPYRPRRFN